MVVAQRIIPRDRVIPGARDDDYHVDSLVHSDERVLSRSVTISRAAMQGLNTTPVVVLPAKTGLRYIVVAAHVSKAAGAYAGGADVTLNYINTENTLAATFDDASFGAAGAVANAWAALPARTGTVAAQTFPAGGIDANVATAFTGAGGAVTITVLYVERSDSHDLADPVLPQTASVTLTSADMVALESTPITLLADPPAGYKYVVLACHVAKAAGAYAAGSQVTVNHTDASETQAVSFPLARFTNAGAQNQWVSRDYTGAVADVTDPEGGLTINTGTAFTDGDSDGSDVTITVRYIQVDA